MTNGYGTSDYGGNWFNITSLDYFSNLSETTRKSINYLYIQHLNVSNLENCLNGFSNLTVLRCEYNNLISLKGIENCKKLEYLFANKQVITNFGKNELDTGYSNDDALFSIEKLENIIHIDLSNNSKFKWSKYLRNLKKLEYLNLSGCDGILDFEQLASLVNGLGENCLYPGNMSSSLIAKDSRILNLKGSTIFVDDFRKLNGATNLYALNLNAAKIVDEGGLELDEEKFNSVVNEVLSTCVNMKYLEFSNQSKLNNIGFVRYMENINELYFDGDEELTDLTVLEEMAESGNLKLYLLVLSNPNIELKEIQKTISIVSDNCFSSDGHYEGSLWVNDLRGFWYSSNVISDWDTIIGLVMNNNDLMLKLSDCTDLTSLFIRPGWRGIFGQWFKGSLDLSNCEKLEKIFYAQHSHRLALPESLEELTYSTSNINGCDLSLCENLKKIKFSCVQAENYCDEILSTLPDDFSSLEYFEMVDQDCAKGKYFNNLDFLRHFEHCKNFKNLVIIQNGNWSRYIWDNLDGLQYAKNLEHIEILFTTNTGGCFADFPDLSGLTKLKSLEIQYGNMNLENIKTCKNLTDLTINNTYIKDVDFLSGVNDLVNVDLSNNLISDIEGLRGKSQIKSLKLGYNSVVDISPLRDLSSATHLELNNNKLSDFAYDSSGKSFYTQAILTDLNQKNNLKDLYLWGNLFDDYSIIKNENLNWDNLILDEKDKPKE